MIRCERSHGPEQRPKVLGKAAVQEESPNSSLLLDNELNQKVLFRQLEIEGFHCTIANHGKAALEEQEASIWTNSPGEHRIKYNLILMDIENASDIRARGGNAYSEMGAQRTTPTRPYPIIAVTENAPDCGDG
ncbi:hypothetical protein BC937DRAFT_94637 [Endogone sp. FLAS-F59071]|nr:hypothetical protein BC937DRAFT_94637 [Endogone sp. FLAS-F59071]|eukprot:RUS20681.1 hypothetical protein BC937DRAFT_94637 [Endogone sp. FLAS-F59071]